MSRRGNSEGSIRKRPDGRWEARISVNGKQRSIYGTTREETARKMRAKQRTVEQGIPLSDERLTVGQFLANWLDTYARPSVRPSTYSSYESYIRTHLVPSLGRHRLAKLGPDHVQAMMNEKLATGLSPRTVLHIRAILRRALGQAVKWGLVTRNAATLVDPPKVSRYKVQPLSPEQATKILAAVKGHRLQALFTVTLSVGLRQGEALGLTWGDIDWSAGTLRVHAALQRINGSLQLVQPKSERSRRTIPLPAKSLDALRQHRTRQDQERLHAGSDWNDGNFVFATAAGMPLDGPSVTRLFQRLLKAAELPPHRFHDLRHDCATLLLAQGVPMRVVMETLGHSQMSLTADTYSHVLPVMQRDAADRMDKILPGN